MMCFNPQYFSSFCCLLVVSGSLSSCLKQLKKYETIDHIIWKSCNDVFSTKLLHVLNGVLIGILVYLSDGINIIR